MCARRFLIVVFICTLLAVAAAVAIFQFGDRILLRSAVPKGNFSAASAGSGPDYAQEASWVALPGLADNPSRWLPDGAVDSPGGHAAIFFVHPTTYLERYR